MRNKQWGFEASIFGLKEGLEQGELTPSQAYQAMVRQIEIARDTHPDGSSEWQELDDMAGCFKWDEDSFSKNGSDDTRQRLRVGICFLQLFQLVHSLRSRLPRTTTY